MQSAVKEEIIVKNAMSETLAEALSVPCMADRRCSTVASGGMFPMFFQGINHGTSLSKGRIE